MYIDFEDHRPEPPSIESAMSRREAVLLSVLFHVGLVLLILFGPRLPFVQQFLAAQAEQQRAAQERQQDLAIQQR